MKVNRALVVFFFIGMVLSTKAIFAVAEGPRMGNQNLARAVQIFSLACLNLHDFSLNLEPKQKCIKHSAKPSKSVSHISPPIKCRSYHTAGHAREPNSSQAISRAHHKAEQSINKEKALLVNLYKEWFRIDRKISKIQRKKIKEMLVNLERSLKELAVQSDSEISENMVFVIMDALPMFVHKAYIMNEFVIPFVSSAGFTNSSEKLVNIELSIREAISKVISQKIAEKLSLLANNGEDSEEDEGDKSFKRLKRPFKPKNHKKEWIKFQISEGRGDYLEDRDARLSGEKPRLKRLGSRKKSTSDEFYHDGFDQGYEDACSNQPVEPPEEFSESYDPVLMDNELTTTDEEVMDINEEGEAFNNGYEDGYALGSIEPSIKTDKEDPWEKQILADKAFVNGDDDGYNLRERQYLNDSDNYINNYEMGYEKGNMRRAIEDFNASNEPEWDGALPEVSCSEWEEGEQEDDDYEFPEKDGRNKKR